MDASIIIVNWNSADYVRECIRSVAEHTHGVPFEVIVVDNASPSDDVDDLKEDFPNITLIKSRENLGFARANNLGFGMSTGEHIVFLNPDTKLLNSAINVMLRHLKSQPNAGILGCKLLNEDLSVQTSCVQRFPTILNQVLDTDYLRRRWPNSRLWGTGPLYSGDAQPVQVEVVSGACMMVKRQVFQMVGMFCEDYFMYGEDVDLCYKVARAGFANWYVGDATVIHYGGKSSVPMAATVMKWRSLVHYCSKNRGWLYALAFRIAMAFAATARLVIIAGVSLFGRNLIDRKTRWSVGAKWRAIFKTLLLPADSARVVLAKNTVEQPPS